MYGNAHLVNEMGLKLMSHDIYFLFPLVYARLTYKSANSDRTLERLEYSQQSFKLP